MRDNQYVTISALEQISAIKHAFTTRQNGLGQRRNGLKMPDDWNAVAETFNVSPDKVVTVNQVHGDTILVVDERNYQDIKRAEADAMVTNVPGIAIGIETADCVPVLLVDPVARVVAAIHAGWRSSVKQIVRKTALKMQQEYGVVPARMIAAIGPAIGPECYEIDEPVMRPVKEAFPFWKDVTVERSAGKWGLDLVKANRIELLQSGLEEKNIYSLGLCTSCRRDLFYSYRAEGRTGRMLSVIMLKTN